MSHVVRDGHVAVILQRGYGSTPRDRFDADFVMYLLGKAPLTKAAEKRLKGVVLKNFYVEWVPIGKKFEVLGDSDGGERIVDFDPNDFLLVTEEDAKKALVVDG